jgi:hypothetical protein
MCSVGAGRQVDVVVERAPELRDDVTQHVVFRVAASPGHPGLRPPPRAGTNPHCKLICPDDALMPASAVTSSDGPPDRSAMRLAALHRDEAAGPAQEENGPMPLSRHARGEGRPAR